MLWWAALVALYIYAPFLMLENSAVLKPTPTRRWVWPVNASFAIAMVFLWPVMMPWAIRLGRKQAEAKG